ncbi:MAG: hypothetical protein C3F11_16150 [Methylocystaceae bacterium]|nr:MAG: hypothetical protein C3F11_16150 [Methylocystaceae bacterium]
MTERYATTLQRSSLFKTLLSLRFSHRMCSSIFLVNLYLIYSMIYIAFSHKEEYSASAFRTIEARF